MTNFFKHKMRRKSAGEIAGWIILGVIAVIAFAILFGLIIMWLWNWLIPSLFGLGTITYWQAVGIFILSKIIFGGLGGGGCKKQGSSKKHRDPCKSGGKGDFSKWEHYDTFWEEEGEAAFNAYIGRRNDKSEGEPPEA